MTCSRSLSLALSLVLVFSTLFFFAWPQVRPTTTEWRLDDDGSHDKSSSTSNSSDETYQKKHDLSAGNSTLGFQALLALSQGTKWRVDGLRAAANASNIDLLIPTQPGWSAEFISSFESFGPITAHGAGLAWLGHIDLLKFVIQNGWGSALILEDDVDWDVRIREQTSLIAEGVKKLTSSAAWGGSGTKQIGTDNPYGDKWDVLWMGHCSDGPDRDKPIVSWPDGTVGPRNRYQGIDRYVTEILKEGERGVHRSRNPVCTFAYAVSAKGARKVLDIAMTAKGGAFDLMLNHSCKEEVGVLDCVSVNPEIFDSYHPAGGDISEVRAGDDHSTATKGAFDAGVGQAMGHADNILRSARCQGLWGSTCLTDA